MINTDHSSFPVQKLPLRSKTKKWKESCVDSIVAREDTSLYGGTNRKDDMMINYGLYNSEYDEKDFKYVTDPFGTKDSFPARMQYYNIIKSRIDLLVGEESKRPQNIKVIQTSQEAVTKLQEIKKELILKYMTDYLGTQQDEQGNTMTPPEIETYMKRKYKTIAEFTGFHILNYYKEKLNINNELLKGWFDALVASEEIYYSGIINGHPVLERVNPVYCDYDKDPDLEFIEDGDWFLRRMDMSPALLYDRHFSLMTEAQLDALLAYANESSVGTTKAGDSPFKGVMYKEKFSTKFFNHDGSGSDGETISVYHAVWRSYKKVGFVTRLDPTTGEENEDLVSEDYKAVDGETIKWEWLPEIWEGYKAGEDIYFGIGPVEYQHVSASDPTNRKLPYCGAIYNNANTEPKSLVKIMKPLQYMYNVLWYRLELTIAKDKGRVLNMDITQVPKGLGISMEKWAYYINALGINFINPYDEGWDIPGREGGKPSAMNQMSSQDLSMSNVIAEYIALLDKIETMLGDICGVSDQRKGAIAQNELVGNVERSVIQSSHITEPLFWKHNQVKKNVLNMLLDTAKHCMANSNDQYLHYILPDGERIFLQVQEDFLFSDLDVFVTDSTKEEQNLQSLRSLLSPALSAGASLAEAAEVIMGENISFIKEKLVDIDTRRQQLEQQAAQAEQESIAQELALKQEELRIKEEDSIRKAATSIQVAVLGGKGENTGNGQEDYDLAQQKVEAAIKKADQDFKIKQAALNETIRKNKRSEAQKDIELSIRRTQASKTNTSKK